MMEGLYGSRAPGERAWTGEPPDPLARPAWFDGVVLRRSIAYLIDGAILFVIGAALFIALSIFGLLTLGLGFHLFPLLSLVPIAYSTLLIGGPDSATWGMRMMDVQVRSWSGERPNMIQPSTSLGLDCSRFDSAATLASICSCVGSLVWAAGGAGASTRGAPVRLSGAPT